MEGGPTNLGVGTEILALDHRDACVAEILEGLKRKVSGEDVIESDIGDAGHPAMSRNCDDRQSAGFGEQSINGDDAFHGALLKQGRVFGDQIAAMAVADHEVEVAFLEEIVFNA